MSKDSADPWDSGAIGVKRRRKAHYLVNNIITMLSSQLANCSVVIKLALGKLAEAYVGTI